MQEVLRDVATWSERGEDSVLATLVRVERTAPLEPGAAFAVSRSGSVSGSISGGCVEPAVCEEAVALLETRGVARRSYGLSDDEAFGVGLTCGGTIDVFLSYVTESDVAVARDVLSALARDETAGLSIALAGPDAGRLTRTRVQGDEARVDMASGLERFEVPFAAPPDMFVFGAIDHATALTRVAKLLGYRVTICDARAAFATEERFPEADRVVVSWPDAFLSRAPVTPRTAICVLTHDEKFDVPLLRAALQTPAGYIGAMGSRETHRKRVARLHAEGVAPDDLARISGPIGLDIGAKTPDEVAVAIAAEIIALRRGGRGGRLSERDGPVHAGRVDAPR